jgi:hypothetical protein
MRLMLARAISAQMPAALKWLARSSGDQTEQ